MQKKLNSCELIGAKKNIPEINRRSVLAMRCIGQGLSALNTFCTIMSLPKPVSQKAYDSINIRIADECETSANASMIDAALEEKNSRWNTYLHCCQWGWHMENSWTYITCWCVHVNWSRVCEGARYRDYVILL
ncbi:hypothetical protein TNCV_1753171 [Trichonephila clavipes]|nr:hypothetical protein TNCV_1753171 [Trichonephila clavipes]